MFLDWIQVYTRNASKDLAKGTIWDKILKDGASEIAINLKYDGYQRGLTSMIYKFFDNKTGLWASLNEELFQELHKQVIKKIKRRRGMQCLKITFGLRIWLEWDHYLLRTKVLIIYYIW